MVDARKLELLLARAEADVLDGRLPSVQVAVARNGVLLATETFGAATPATRYVLQSAGRSVVASVLWKLIGSYSLEIERPVSFYIPEFGGNGKQDVTVEQVVTHVGGFPLAPLGYPKMLSRGARLDAMASWRLTFEPGSRLEFHLTSAAWVIGELVERLTGLSFRDFLRKGVTGPLGLTSLDVAVPVEDQTDVAPFILVDGDPLAETNPWGPWYLSTPEVLAAGEPSHSVVSTAPDLAMLFQGIAHSGSWDASVVEDATRVRVTFPVEGERGNTASVPGNVGLFVVGAGDDGLSRGFLPVTGTPGLWGHGGAPCQIAFYDPGTGLSFAYLTNGYPASGYESTRSGRNRITNIGNLAADLC